MTITVIYLQWQIVAKKKQFNFSQYLELRLKNGNLFPEKGHKMANLY